MNGLMYLLVASVVVEHHKHKDEYVSTMAGPLLNAQAQKRSPHSAIHNPAVSIIKRKTNCIVLTKVALLPKES